MTQKLYFPVLLIYSIYLNSQHCTFNTKIGAFFGIMKEKKIVQIFKEREKYHRKSISGITVDNHLEKLFCNIIKRLMPLLLE